MSKSKKQVRKTVRRKGSIKHNKSNRIHRTKSTKRTRCNWMKQLKGGDASHHAENVFGQIGQQHALSANNNAIYQNPLNQINNSLPGSQIGGKKQKRQ